MKTLNEVCKIVGLSRRMIQEYESGKDAIAVTPTTKNKYGYLLYNEEQIEHLQTIKFYREAGYSKKQIKEIFDNPNTNSQEILQNAIISLEKKRSEIERSIETAQLMLQLNTTPDKMLKYFNPDDIYPYRKLRMTYMQKALSTPDMFISPDNLSENIKILMNELKKLMDNSVESHSEKAQYYVEQLRTAFYPYISDSIACFLKIGKLFTIKAENNLHYIGEAIIHYCSIHEDDSQFDKDFNQTLEQIFNTFEEDKIQESIQSFYDCIKKLGIWSEPIQFLKLFTDLYLDELWFEYFHALDDTNFNETEDEWLIEYLNFIHDEFYLFCDTIQNNH